MPDESSGRPVTRAQRLIWTGQQLDAAAPLYNMALTFRIAGRVDPLVFATAFDDLVLGTDAMRTIFDQVRGQPLRRVVRDVPVSLELVDLAGTSDPERRLDELVTEATEAPFDLTSALYRSGLVSLSESEHVWWLVQHHLITDGWATAIVFKRLEQLYAGHAKGDQQHDEYPTFEDYADVEERMTSSPAHRTALEHWRREAAAELEPLSFYGQHTADTTTRTERTTVKLGRGRSDAVSAFVEEAAGSSLVGSVSHFAVYAAALAALVSRVSGQRRFVILAPAHNRPSPKFKNTAGLFIEVLPLTFDLSPESTFRDVLDQAGSRARDLLVHGLPGTSAADHNRNAAVLLNFVNVSFGDFNGWPVATEWRHPGHGDREHAVRLQIHDFDGSDDWTVHFDMREDVFDDDTRRRFIDDFLAMLDALLADVDQPISNVDLIPADTRAALDAVNATTREIPFTTILDAFAHQVETVPAAEAVRSPERSLTYSELDAQATALARRLVGAGERVGIWMRRSADVLVAVLGVLKSGRAFVPIDMNNPEERVRFIVSDAELDVVITNMPNASELLPGDIQLMAPVASPSPPADHGVLRAGDAAYVIYTSGSTGLPKGVVVAHHALANYISHAAAAYGRDAPVAFPLYSSIGFDLTITSMFTPLVSGGTVVVYPEGDGADLAVLDVFAEDAVDVVKLTPAHLAIVDPKLLQTSRIRTLIVGGEDFKSEVARRAFAASGDKLEIINEYGPTEATVGCTVHRFDPAADRNASVPIGTPIANMRIHILDDDLGEAPPGVVGEIWIAGAGVAEGYLGRAELTRDRFRDALDGSGQRAYRTGDMGRWSARGQLEFLGRRDDQVKIRGHRIELGEVESAIRRHPDIRDVAVSVFESETHRSVEAARLCVRCGLTDAHPEAQLDAAGVCQPCHFHDKHEADAAAYFSTSAELDRILEPLRKGTGEPDCLMLLSGGKDSTYALYQLVERGLTPLVFSLDNGFISEGAKANIRRAVDDLGLELVWGSTPAMNEIFADSLSRFSNVCQGCFKTIYTLGINLARERGLTHIITGLSRGQIYETRLADLFRVGITDPDEIDAAVVEARRAYHRMDDAVRRRLDTDLFDTDIPYEDIRIVDFYRYVDVGLDVIYGFLGSRAPWVRPADTGRSTNCLINNTGIFVHKAERGYHNYALPYSWDVRLGHKTREAALAELDDDIDVTQVKNILQALPYEPDYDEDELAVGSEARLAAYYTPATVPVGELRSGIGTILPAALIPSYFVPVEEIPLTVNGKVDRRALPDPRSARSIETAGVPPTGPVESKLAEIWADVLGLEELGVTDEFLDLGGDSILNIQIVSRATHDGLDFSPVDLFQAKTIRELAKRLTVSEPASPLEAGDQGETGSASLTDLDLAPEELASILERYGETT